MSSDADLVARCLADEPLALRELVERFERPVLSLCLKMLRHRQDAEDVAQESLVRVCRHLRTWDGDKSLLPWVLAIAANRCRTALERRGRLPIATDSWAEPVATGLREGDLNASELGEAVARALGLLRAEHRECFILYYEQELSVQQISQQLGVPDGTVKTWLHRSRKQVAEHLRARGYHAE